MRYLLMHKTNAYWEGGGLPAPELFENMGKLVADIEQAGVMRGTEGLRASVHGVRLRFAGGKHTLKRGPLTGDNELPAGFLIVRAKSLDAAIDWGVRLGAVLGDVEIDVRPVNEPWDVGICPRPADHEGARYMLLHKATPETESGAPPGAQLVAAMGRLLAEMERSGALLLALGLQPSSAGLRLQFQGERCTVIDGPFAESKELIAGYCLVEVDTREQAVVWVKRFAAVVGDVEADIRPLYEPA